ncbi:hypothetical protein [Nostoc sp.]|uniref:hypothetical protein n=1 Tax=Nostoc sp. TaxID=1180 RepID=UPI002FFD54F2
MLNALRYNQFNHFIAAAIAAPKTFNILRRRMSDIAKQWEKLKQNLPIGHKFYGEVISVKPFGVFVYLGYQVIDGYKLSGIIHIGTKPDCDSSGLPTDTSLWPQVSQRVHCKVIAYREYNKEVDLRLVQ